MKLPLVLRLLLLAWLAAVALSGAPWARRETPREALRFSRSGPEAIRAALLGVTPARVLREAAVPPRAGEMDTLAALAARAPLFVAAPRARWRLAADAPMRPLSGRLAAVGFRLYGPPGGATRVRLDGADRADSVRVRLDASGLAAGAFRVRPPRAGLRRWTISADSAASTSAAVWVDSAAAPRVELRAGAPDWEVKFVARALEESGVTVRVTVPLGRGLTVVGGPASPASEPPDVVIVAGDAPADAATRARLTEFAERGGGLLLAGAAAARWSGGGGALAAQRGDAIRWSAPAELVPLPARALRVSAATLRVTGAGGLSAVAARSANGAPLLTLRAVGRGRVAALALADTWRWRMEAGDVEAHREFWRALVDWLASAPRRAWVVRPERTVLSPGAVAEMALIRGADSVSSTPPPLRLIRPDGAGERLPAVPDPAQPGVWRARFTADRAGEYRLSLSGDTGAVAGVLALAQPPAADDAWARLAWLAARSGGAVLPADSLRRLATAPGGADRAGGRFTRLFPLLAFAVALLLAGAEWALRRLRGLP